MSLISRNLSIILRTERLITRRRMSVLRTQTGLMIFAGLVATLGLIMLDVAAFFAIEAYLSPQSAALIIALVNLGLATIVVSIASRLNAERDLEPVVELRDQAIAELEAEVVEVMTEAREMSDNVRRIARDPLGSVLPAIIGPLLAALARSTKK